MFSSIRHPLAAGCFCLTLLLAFAAADEKEEREKLRKERLEAMRKLVDAIQVEVGEGDALKRIKAKSDPLLRFDDATRDFYDGAVFMYADGGRPHLLLAVERYEKKWSFELTLITAPPIVVTSLDAWKWKPRLPPFKFETLPDLVPSEKATTRKAEMNKILERFTAVEFYSDEGRRELRLLARPMHQYTDEKQGIIDGALFAFANGTNPEVLVILEARADKEGKRTWQYALQRLSGARCEVELDGKLVWEALGGTLPKSQGPYSWFTIPFTAAESLEAVP
jgi:hypothetical protein